MALPFSRFGTWFKKFSIASVGKNNIKSELGRVQKETFIAIAKYDLRIFMKDLRKPCIFSASDVGSEPIGSNATETCTSRISPNNIAQVWNK